MAEMGEKTENNISKEVKMVYLAFNLKKNINVLYKDEGSC